MTYRPETPAKPLHDLRPGLRWREPPEAGYVGHKSESGHSGGRPRLPLSEETTLRPKPMVEIGGKPILWHIMNIYAAPRRRRVRRRARLSRRGHQGVLPELLRAQQRHHGGPVDGRARRSTRAASRAGRCTSSTPGCHDADRRPGQAPRQVARRRRDVHADLRRRRRRRGHRARCSRSTSRTASSRRSRPCARRPASAASSSTATASSEFTEKPQTGEGWINGGFFVLNRGVLRLHRRRRDAVGARADGAPGRATAS